MYLRMNYNAANIIYSVTLFIKLYMKLYMNIYNKWKFIINGSFTIHLNLVSLLPNANHVQLCKYMQLLCKKNQTSTLEIINNYIDFVTSVITGGNKLTCTSTVLVFLSGILFVRTKNQALLYYIFFCFVFCIAFTCTIFPIIRSVPS